MESVFMGLCLVFHALAQKGPLTGLTPGSDVP